MLKNMQTTEQGMIGIHNLSTGPHKEIRIYEWIFLEIFEGSFPVIFWKF